MFTTFSRQKFSAFAQSAKIRPFFQGMHAPITTSIQKDPCGEGSIWRGHYPPVGASRQFLIDLPGEACRNEVNSKLQKFLGVPVNLQEMEALHPLLERWLPMVLATVDWKVT